MFDSLYIRQENREPIREEDGSIEVTIPNDIVEASRADVGMEVLIVSDPDGQIVLRPIDDESMELADE